MDVGWQVIDQDGRVVESGEVTLIEVDLEEEITQRLTELTAADIPSMGMGMSTDSTGGES